MTLVEVAVVAGIVLILATVASYGVRKHFAAAKSAEALATLGAINKAVFVSADRLADSGSRVAAPGASSAVSSRPLCGDAVTVPISFTPVRGSRYQPNNRDGNDYDSGDDRNGWKCLGYENNTPQYYQYRYRLDGAPIYLPGRESWLLNVPANQRYCVYARGDLDGDFVTSWFILDGYVKDGQLTTTTEIATVDPDE